MAFRIGLLRGPSNYSFFDPRSGLNLSIGNPVGFANRVTPMILRGLKHKTLLDLDGVIDIKKGVLKAEIENPAEAAFVAPEIELKITSEPENAPEMVSEPEPALEEVPVDVDDEVVAGLESEEVPVDEEPETTEKAVSVKTGRKAHKK